MKTLASLVRGGKALVLLRLKLMFTTFYRVCFLACLAESVVLERLNRGPVTDRDLLGGPGADPSLSSAAQAWLHLGVRLGVLREGACRAIREMGLQDRVEILAGDVRDCHSSEPFDILTLYNNIYYFPVEDRVTVLGQLLGLLRPGGRIVITTGCLGGSIEFELVNLIHSGTRGWGRLPERDEMLRQMEDAGFVRSAVVELIPGNGYHAFIGHRPVPE